MDAREEDRQALRLFERFVVAAESAAASLALIAGDLKPISDVAVAAQFLIGGKPPMAGAAFPLQDIQQVPYGVTGTDADGDPTSLAPTGATLSLTSSDPTICAVVPDATPAAGTIGSGNLVGQSKLGTVVIDGNVVDANGNVLFKPAGLPFNLIVNASVATGAAFALGTPVNQAPPAAPPANPPASARAGFARK